MREAFITILVATLGAVFLSCGGGTFVPGETSSSSIPLPDLRIKRVEYRKQNKQQLNPMRSMSSISPTIIGLDYEFVVHIENVGGQTFEEPFYLSTSGSLIEFQDRLFSRHILLNNEHQRIATGQIVHFTVPLRLDFPPPRQRISYYPIRFYINTEGPDNSTGYPTNHIEEQSYKNNFYELQIRL